MHAEAHAAAIFLISKREIGKKPLPISSITGINEVAALWYNYGIDKTIVTYAGLIYDEIFQGILGMYQMQYNRMK